MRTLPSGLPPARCGAEERHRRVAEVGDGQRYGVVGEERENYPPSSESARRRCWRGAEEEPGHDGHGSTELGAAVERAHEAYRAAQDVSPDVRAGWLEAVAEAMEQHSDELVRLAQAETHLAEGRLRGELTRTTFQLRLFAAEVVRGEVLDATIDHADAAWGMGPRPDLRRVNVPLGVVGVFGASNFPFAFSVMGGDSASALAAGCAVVHKVHEAHEELGLRTAEVVVAALTRPGRHRACSPPSSADPPVRHSSTTRWSRPSRSPARRAGRSAAAATAPPRGPSPSRSSASSAAPTPCSSRGPPGGPDVTRSSTSTSSPSRWGWDSSARSRDCSSCPPWTTTSRAALHSARRAPPRADADATACRRVPGGAVGDVLRVPTWRSWSRGRLGRGAGARRADLDGSGRAAGSRSPAGGDVRAGQHRRPVRRRVRPGRGCRGPDRTAHRDDPRRAGGRRVRPCRTSCPSRADASSGTAGRLASR